MPTPIKIVTMFNEDTGFGWTETHYINAPESEPNLGEYLERYSARVVPSRALMLGEGAKIVGYRASYRHPKGIRSNGARAHIPGYKQIKTADFAQSLSVQFVDALSARKKIVHLRGFWDRIEENSEYIGESDSEWAGNFKGWYGSLIRGGYGWLTDSDTLSRKGTVTGYTVDPDGRVLFSLGGVGLDNVAVGDVVSVRFSRLNNSDSVLNRQLLCEVMSPNTVKTTAPIAAGQFSGQGRYNYRRTEFVAYSEVGAVAIGKRAMGRPLFHAPGRQKARART